MVDLLATLLLAAIAVGVIAAVVIDVIERLR